MMGIKVFLLLVLWCSAAVAADESTHGLVKLDGSGHVLLVVDAPLTSTSLVIFQYPDARGRALCCKQLLPSDFVRLDSEAAELTVANLLGEADTLIYQARIPRLWAVEPFVGAAAVGSLLKVSAVQGKLAITSKDGRRVQVSTCSSQEGVHLIVKRGHTELAHLYLSLGYEVLAPTCSPVDVGDTNSK